MRRLSGFSLMEMMTVLLIVSVVAAASAPMISKKMSVAPAGAGGAGAGGCQWETVDGEGIAYNTEGDKDQTVIIGAGNRPEKTQARLHIDSNNAASPQITLTDSSTKEPTTAKLIYNNGSFGLTTSASDLGKDAVAIGEGASASKVNAVAIGADAGASNDNAVAIGAGAVSDGYAVAIGAGAVSDGSAVAIGDAAHSYKLGSIAIGEGAKAHLSNSIAIGGLAATSGADTAHKSIAIGDGAKTYGSQCVSIGALTESGSDEAMGAIAIGTYEDFREIWPDDPSERRTKATGQGSIALGRAAQATHHSAIAIGRNVAAINSYATAIGDSASALANNSIAIGTLAYADKPNQIVLGTQDDTVYIPGNLIVGNYSYFGSSLKGADLAVAGQWGNGGLQGFIGDVEGDGKFDIINAGGNRDFRKSNIRPGYDGALSFLKGNGWPLSSDRRLKNVGKAFTAGLAELKKLDLFHYTYKKDESNTPHVGVMAQDLQKVFPDAVTKGEDGFLRIRMEDMFYALVNAVKELASMFDKQDEKIVQLEKENKQLQKTVADLEKQNSEILKRLAKLEKQK